MAFTGSTEKSARFASDPTSPRRARAFVASTLDAWGWSELTGDAAIVTSELVNNAVLHAHSALRVDLLRTDSALRIEVTDLDETPVLLPSPMPDADARSGRGLPLVLGLSSAFGSDPRGDGKVVWAELPAPTVGRPRTTG